MTVARVCLCQTPAERAPCSVDVCGVRHVRYAWSCDETLHEAHTFMGSDRRAPDAAQSFGIHVPCSRPTFKVSCASMLFIVAVGDFWSSLLVNPACAKSVLVA